MPKIFDTPPTINQDPMTAQPIYTPRQPGLLSKFSTIGNAAIAPWVQLYGGNMDYEIAQQKLQMQQDAQDMEFQKYLVASGVGKPIFTIDPVTGAPQQIGVLPKGGQFVPPTTLQTPEQKTEEAVVLTQKKDAAVRSQKLSELNKAVDFFETKIKDVPGGKGVAGRVQGLGVAASGVLQTNPKVAAYMSSVEGLRSQIARGLGEVGNLSEYEQKYAINLLPKATDNLETRQQKLDNFRDYIKTRLGQNEDSKSKSPKITATPEQRTQYNKLRSSGISAEEARKKVGF